MLLVKNFRYAFILFDDEQEAADVVNQAKRYRINGHQLTVSLYCNRKFSPTTTGTYGSEINQAISYQESPATHKKMCTE